MLATWKIQLLFLGNQWTDPSKRLGVENKMDGTAVQTFHLWFMPSSSQSPLGKYNVCLFVHIFFLFSFYYGRVGRYFFFLKKIEIGVVIIIHLELYHYSWDLLFSCVNIYAWGVYSGGGEQTTAYSSTSFYRRPPPPPPPVLGSGLVEQYGNKKYAAWFSFIKYREFYWDNLFWCPNVIFFIYRWITFVIGFVYPLFVSQLFLWEHLRTMTFRFVAATKQMRFVSEDS